MELRVVAVVSAGGVLGAAARSGIEAGWPHAAGGFPWATWVINVSGCFLLGLVAVLVGQHRYWRPFLGTGVLGGYTTFSTWAVETLQSRPLVAAGYVGATVAGALLAAWAGGAVVRRR